MVDSKSAPSTPPAGKEMAEANKASEVAVANDNPVEGTPLEGAVLLGANDEVDLKALTEVSGGQEFVTLQKDVIEEFFYPNTTTPAHRVAFTAGQVVAKSVLDERNRLARLAAKGIGLPIIDASTAAAGTLIPEEHRQALLAEEPGEAKV